MELSIIIVSFNTIDVTMRCLASLKKNLSKYPISHEVIVVDNGSKDSSPEALRKLKKNWPELKLIESPKNIGYGKGNNLGLAVSKGKYVLYLNSDAIVSDIDFKDLTDLFERDEKLAGVTIKVLLPTGGVDPASHRGFPTPWSSVSYYLGLEKLFSKIPFFSQWFGGYHLTHLDLNTVHEIDVPTGAFFMVRSKIVKEIKGFDEDYFAYGEDIEMAYQIKRLGYKILYYPLWEVLHLKSVSGLKKKDRKISAFTRFHFYNSMKIFYKKHYEKKYPRFFNKLIYLAIDLKKVLAS